MSSRFCQVLYMNRLMKRKALKPLISPYNKLSTNNPVINKEVDTSENIITKKLAALVKWYEEITGMDGVRKAQNRVLEAEEKFIAAQERRMEATKAVTEIQTKLKDIHAALDSTTRGEDRYVQLISQEHQILKEEKKRMTEFQQLEREERDYFSMLSSAVKESHEQERAQAEKTKYWSIIGSIIGTIIGVIGSSINNSLKMKELRKLIKDSVANNDQRTYPTEILPKYEEELSKVIAKLKTVASLSEDDVIKELKHMVNILSENARADNNSSGKNISVTDSLNRQTLIMEKHFTELKSMLSTKHFSTSELQDDRVVLISNGFEERLQNRQQVTQMLVVGSALLVVTFPYFLKFTGLA